jgi:hypothetical protein
MVIVFIKAMQVGWAHGVPSAHGGLTRLLRASTTLVRFNCDGDKAKSALRTVDDLRQLNQLFSYTRAQDSAQEQGVCDESVIGGSPQWLE